MKLVRTWMNPHKSSIIIEVIEIEFKWQKDRQVSWSMLFTIASLQILLEKSSNYFELLSELEASCFFG